jgi:3D (Asp-Asp-Asp) domain-containing protein
VNWKELIAGVLIGLITGCVITPMPKGKIETPPIAKKEKKMSVNAVRWVDCTAYTASKDETDSDPTITASMTKVRPGIIAVSRDLFDQGWVFGKKVYIHGLGVYTIADLMNKRYINRIDVFLGTKEEATKFGLNQMKISLLEM